MAFYVYIIQSELDNSFYKGFTENPRQRLAQHNNKESSYTAAKTPWKLVFVEQIASKAQALKREKNLKKATIDRILALIKHEKNIVHQFTD